MQVPCRRVFEGSATGKVALSTAPLSFLGEIDPQTGKVDNPASELHGQSVAGRVLVFPHARGSTVGPYVVYGARKRGSGPIAMVVHEADAIVASAAVIARLPCVDRVDVDIFRDGDEVRVDGTQGTLELPHVKATNVVTAFLQDGRGRVLLLKRSEKVRSFQGRWAGVSGYLESPSPLEQAYREIGEEVGIARDQLALLGEAPPIFARDRDEMFVVHPFLFRLQGGTVKLDWEHTELAWVDPSEIAKRETVPKLLRVWESLASATQAASPRP